MSCYFGWLSSCIISDAEHLVLWQLRIAFVLLFPLKCVKKIYLLQLAYWKSVVFVIYLQYLPQELSWGQLPLAALSVQFSCSVMSNSSQPHGLQHARLPCPSPSPRACSNSCPLSWWCYPTISSSVVPFSSCLQSFLPSGSFLMSLLLASGGQSIGVSASTSILPVNIQDWFPSGRTGWISLQSKGLSRVFSNTTVQKHQFFCTQLSLWSNSHIHTWLLEKP